MEFWIKSIAIRVVVWLNRDAKEKIKGEKLEWIEKSLKALWLYTHTHTSLLKNKRKNNYIDKRDIDLVFLC